MCPSQAADYLVDNRTRLRKAYRKVLRDQPDAAIGAPWVRSRGKLIPTLANERFVPLFRDTERPGAAIDEMTLAEAVEFCPRDLNLAHPADLNLTRGWVPSL